MFRSYVSELLVSEDGNFAILFALLMLPLMVLSGSAVDFTHMQSVRKSTQIALDAAVLDAAHKIHSHSSSVLEKEVSQYVNAIAESGTSFTIDKLVIDKKENFIEVRGRRKTQTHFIKLVGVNELEFATVSRVYKPTEAVEISLVLDVSSSMRMRGRISNLRKAVKLFADTIFQDKKRSDNTIVNLVPFGGSVHLGSGYKNWLSSPVAQWSGCFIPKKFYHKSADDDLRHSHSLEAVGNFTIWVETNPWCPKSQSRAEPFLSSKKQIYKSVDRWVLSDGTGTDIGVSWGLRMLSPKWRGKFHSNKYPQDFTNTKKYMIVMTDGGTTWQTNSTANNETYNQNTARDNLAYGCAQAKKMGIVVHTVLFEENRRWIIRDMEDCAKNSGSFFRAKNGRQLNDVFESIARSIRSPYIGR